MTWPDEVTLAGFATVVVVVVTIGATVVVVVGAAVVVVVAATVVVVTTVAGFGVVAVAFAVVDVVAMLDDAEPLDGAWPEGTTPGITAVGDAGVTPATGEVEGWETVGVASGAAGASGAGCVSGAPGAAAEAALTTRGTPPF
jgi:hypothetical protein